MSQLAVIDLVLSFYIVIFKRDKPIMTPKLLQNFFLIQIYKTKSRDESDQPLLFFFFFEE